MVEKHIALFPFGPIRAFGGSRDRLVELIYRCDADPVRTYDTYSTPGALAHVMERIPRLVSGDHKPLMVCTAVNPLNLTVLSACSLLCARFPVLKRTLWVICVDTECEPFLWANAQQLGELVIPSDFIPPGSKKDELFSQEPRCPRLWCPNKESRSFEGQQFLMLTEKMEPGQKFRTFVAELWADTEKNYVPTPPPPPFQPVSSNTGTRSKTLPRFPVARVSKP